LELVEGGDGNTTLENRVESDRRISFIRSRDRESTVEVHGENGIHRVE